MRFCIYFRDDAIEFYAIIQNQTCKIQRYTPFAYPDDEDETQTYINMVIGKISGQGAFSAENYFIAVQLHCHKIAYFLQTA